MDSRTEMIPNSQYHRDAKEWMNFVEFQTWQWDGSIDNKEALRLVPIATVPLFLEIVLFQSVSQ
jgi:hypothetical protein